MAHGLLLVLQYLEELMSTRLGVQRKGEVLSADRRTGPDGREYYDIQVNCSLTALHSRSLSEHANWNVRQPCPGACCTTSKGLTGFGEAAQVRVRSYASRNQLAAYPGDRQAGQELEWERRWLWPGLCFA